MTSTPLHWSLAELRARVAELPAQSVARLRAGAAPDGRCGVCEALALVAPHVPVKQGLAVAELAVWHDEGLALFDELRQALDAAGYVLPTPLEAGRLRDALEAFVGGLAHARCELLYAFARDLEHSSRLHVLGGCACTTQTDGGVW